MATPVFVLGSPRNGTTWLSNILGSHPSIGSIQHEAHWGTHESSIFTNWLYWDHFESTDDFIEFVELYASADYFRISDVEDKYFREDLPDDFLDFYFALMDRHASKNGCRYWTTKIDPLIYPHQSARRALFDRIEARYSDAKFIAVQRSLKGALRSYLSMQGQQTQKRNHLGVREMALSLQTARYASHYTEIESILSNQEGLLFQFRELNDHRAEVAARIIDFLNLSHAPSVLDDEYPANSSFKGRSRQPKIPRWELFTCLHVLRPLFFLFPVLAHTVLLIRDRLRDRNGPALYWRLLKLQRMPDHLKNELKAAGQVGLLEVLFSNDPD